MGKWFKTTYFKSSKIKEHVFGSLNVGNCALCGEFTSLDKHHRVTQSRGGQKEDEINVCRKCHDWIGTHPEEAMKYGLYLEGYKIKKEKVL